MTDSIYLACINRCSSVFAENLASDLRKCVSSPVITREINFDLELYYSGERDQYFSTQILSELRNRIPKDGIKIVGITAVDIYIPILTFLFGEAQLNGNAALVSTYRLRNEFYGLPANEELFYQRILKEVLHELGHTFGLVHCANYQCVMNSSTYVEDIDLKLPTFCSACRTAGSLTCANTK